MSSSAARSANNGDSLESQVYQVISETFQIPLPSIPKDIAMGRHPRWDSMGHMNLIVRLEKAFGIRFAVPAIRTMTDVSQIVKAIEAKRTKS